MRFLTLSETAHSTGTHPRQIYREDTGAYLADPDKHDVCAPFGLVIDEGAVSHEGDDRIIREGGNLWKIGPGKEVPCRFDGTPSPRVPNAPFHENCVILGFHFRIFNNIGHFISDQLPILFHEDRLWDAGFRKIVISQIRSEPLMARIREMVALLCRHPFEVVFETHAREIRMRHALVPQGLSINPHGKAPELAHLFRRALRPAPAPGERVKLYVSRLDAGDRHPVDEPGLAAFLERHGYITVRASELTIPQSRDLFGRAEIVLGPMGAALAHMVFCQPGTKLVVFSPEAADGNWFGTLARILGLDLLSYWTPHTGERTELRRFSEDFAVDRDRLLAVTEDFAAGRVAV
ncbi:glycosyltransferase family 61 protein [Aliigemmobacter aestuarii]|uniref:Glycosyltransferase family 61 protein n=1 Tax=Aliigemmobacter aestuarii TaxID=1445661 RepID=A0A4S3MM58_9RHOB|nr:glycosyltransferase 61 family protein [Gemmobacter aestuarii]THD83135.1 glycosyltransferase family 61 protein [Gemmobacter aestuarii]